MTAIFDIEDVRDEQSPEISVGEIMNLRSLKSLKLRYWLFKGDTETDARAAEMVENEELVQLIDYGVEELCRKVSWWNLAVNGEVVALDPDVVRERVPTPIQSYVGQAIRRHQNPERRGRRK